MQETEPTWKNEKNMQSKILSLIERGEGFPLLKEINELAGAPGNHVYTILI
jgi:hypothetical protein